MVEAIFKGGNICRCLSVAVVSAAAGMFRATRRRAEAGDEARRAHCSGDRTRALFEQAYGGAYIPVGVGTVIEVYR